MNIYSSNSQSFFSSIDRLNFRLKKMIVNLHESGLSTENYTERNSEDFVCDGAPRELPKRGSKRPKGSFKEKNSKNRLHGAGYIKFNTSNLVPPKTLGARCTGKCKKLGKQCRTISNEDRMAIFKAFYAIETPLSQREFICRHVEANHVKANTVGESSRRKDTISYYLTIRRKRTKVCKRFFLSTLSVSERVVRTRLQKISDVGILDPEKRGGRVDSNKKRDSLIRKLVEVHIDRFPRIESHYCRQNTDREYLSSDLSLSKMHRMFCVEQTEKATLVSYTFYSTIFHEKNLSFHHPKKDQCSLCNTYRTGDPATKAKLEAKYTSHIEEKEKIRKIKAKCKEESMKSALVASAAFDLEQVFNFPMSLESLVFYKRRLAGFNFTMYELGTKNCDCYFWDETQSRRGSSEIASCVFSFLQRLDETKHIKANLFADGCPGQNKNTIIACMLLYFVRESKNVNEVSLRFFETTHGQNEGDSAHSAISTAVDDTGEILVPSMMPSIIEKARHNNPYKVHVMTFKDFLDFKSYSQSLNVLSVRKNDDGSGTINWTDVMEIRVIKSAPNTLFYKNSHTCDEYKSITLKKSICSRVGKLNAEQMKITAAKYNDLISLCTGDVRVILNNDHIKFYKTLPHFDK